MTESNALNMVVQSSAGLINVLSRSREFLEEVLGDSDDFVAIVDRDLNILWTSYRLQKLFPHGYANKSLYDLLEKQAKNIIKRKLRTIRQVNQSTSFELSIFENETEVPCLWSLRYVEVFHQGSIVHEIFCLSGTDISELSILQREASLKKEYKRLKEYSTAALHSSSQEDLIMDTIELLVDTGLKGDYQCMVTLLLEKVRIGRGNKKDSRLIVSEIDDLNTIYLPDIHHSQPLSFEGKKVTYGIFGSDKRLTGAIEMSIQSNIEKDAERSRLFSAILHTFAASLAKLRYRKQLDNISEYRSTKIAVGFLQRRIFGKSMSVNIDVKPFYLPSDRCGGDWYSIYPSVNGQSTVYLADVTGHGMGAALVAGFMNGVVKSCHEIALREGGTLSAGERISKVLENLSTIVFDQYETRFMASMIAMELIPEKEEIVLVNAGHVPPLHYSSKSDEVRPILGASNLIGFSKSIEFNVVSQKVDKKDKLLIYSDGVIENVSDESGRLDRRELRKHFKRHGKGATTWEEFTKKVREYMPYRLTDDVTIITLNFK